jgi:hypothetical protein
MLHMSTPRFAFLLVPALIGGGCAAHMPVYTDSNAVITGTLTELAANEHIKTKELKRIKIHYKQDGVPKQYEILFGPNPGTGEEAEGWYHTSQPAYRVDAGWGYMAGDKPYGELEKVTAMTEGTTILVQTLAGVKRVYLLKKKIIGNDKVIVRLTLPGGGTAEKIVSTNKWKDDCYVQTNAAMDALEGPFNLKKAPPDIRSFVDYVRQRAIDARITDAKK